MRRADIEREVAIPVDRGSLGGTLSIPAGARALVLFAHGSGSGRFSPRNRQVAAGLQGAGFAKLLFDLLLPEEEPEDRYSREYRFDVELLAPRLAAATRWAKAEPELAERTIGYFGASTGAAAALLAAAVDPDVAAIVSRGGRPDLAGPALASVRAPTLLIVGGDDPLVVELNRSALRALGSPVKNIAIVEGATHLFEEAGTLEEVTRLAIDWFERHL